MSNEFRIGNKLQLQNGFAMTLGRAAADPGSPIAGDMYYNTVSNLIRYYNGSTWANVDAGTAGFATTALNNLAAVAINTSLVSDTDVTDNLGSASIRWLNLYVQAIKDSANVTVLDVNARLLNDVAGNDSINFESRQAFDSAEVESIEYNSRTLSDAAAGSSIEWENRLLNDSTASVSLDYENRQLRSGATVKLDWSATDLNVNTRKIINLSDPTSAQDAATKVYVDNLAQGLKPKQAVRAATTVNGTLATDFDNGSVIDGVTLVTGNRILIKNQTAQEDNGIYIVQASGAPVRSSDFDSLSPIDEVNGAYVAVQEGTTQEGQVFVQQGTVAVIGVDPIIFVFFNAATGANVSLSNLSGVAINTSLISDTDITDNLGSAALRWLNLYAQSIKDSADVTAMDIDARLLNDVAGNQSLNLDSRQLFDSASVPSIEYNSRILYDDTSAQSVNYNDRVLSDASGNTRLDWSAANTDMKQTVLRRSDSAAGSNYIDQQYIDAVTLTANTTVTVTSYVAANFEGAIVDYKIKQASSGAVRTGQMYISNNGTSTVSSSDNYTETLDAEVILSADINGSDIRLRAQNTDAANNSIMRLDIKRIRT